MVLAVVAHASRDALNARVAFERARRRMETLHARSLLGMRPHVQPRRVFAARTSFYAAARVLDNARFRYSLLNWRANVLVTRALLFGR